jgi:hypothetical protein
MTIYSRKKEFMLGRKKEFMLGRQYIRDIQNALCYNREYRRRSLD